MKHTWISYTAALAIVFFAGTTSAMAQADLSLTFSGGPEFIGTVGVGTGGPARPVAPGSVAEYGFLVFNSGPAAALGVVVTITFPVGITIAPLNSPGCSSSLVAGNPTVTCSQASLASGGSYAGDIVVGLANNYPWQNGLTATASVTSSTPDPLSSNNSVTDHLVVDPPVWIPAMDTRVLAALIAVLALVGVVSVSRT
ncbi:MAG TPA: hypothetical protein VNN25_04905 [Thermoanaerobaculia bacterium]|nr:hypothetical protein [Thermoanaerobaculia bacterium]